VVQLGNGRFLSTENDLRLTVIYVACLVLLIFGGEALAGNRAVAGTQNPTTPGPGHPGGTQFENRTILTLGGTTSEGQTTPVEFAINTSAAWITATLEWTDDIGSNDDFGITLKMGSNELASDHSTSGKASVTVRAEESGNLTGAFTIEVKAINCPGMVAGSPIDRDSGNSWGLTVEGSVAVK